MANNLFTGFNVVRATATATFTAAGLNATNCSIVIEVNPSLLKSWIPGRGINPVTTFTSGKGYYIIMKQDADLSAYLVPPVPAGGSVNWGDIGGLLEDQGDLNDALEALALAITDAVNATSPELVATKADISASTTPRLISVAADETNNGDESLYFFNGTSLKQIQLF